MTIKELIMQLEQSLESHYSDELVCIYDQETGECYDIEIVDDTTDGEVQLNVKEFNNG
jgi:hypothetical protein